MAAPVLFLVATSHAPGASYYLATDVPATLRGTDYAGAILRSDGALYSVALSFPGGGSVQTAALHRRADALWLQAADAPFLLGRTPVKSHDIVATSDGMTFSVFFDETAAGIPDYAGIDLDSAGNLVFSFNVPVNLGGVEPGRRRDSRGDLRCPHEAVRDRLPARPARQVEWRHELQSLLRGIGLHAAADRPDLSLAG